MNELHDLLQIVANSDGRFAMARVVETWGSSPRPVGAAMLVSESGQMTGSVSGGCVEGDVLKAAKTCIEKHQTKLLSYGIADEDAWSVGLSCGGKLSVWVEPISKIDGKLPSIYREMVSLLKQNKAFILLSDISSAELSAKLIPVSHDYQVPWENVRKKVEESGQSGIYQLENKQYFAHYVPVKPRLLVFGAVHLAIELMSLAKGMGFEIIVIDPRQAFADNTTAMENANQVIVGYPSEVLPTMQLDMHTYCAILSHDPKIDDDALNLLLRSDVKYIGALGSRKTHEKRKVRLKERGFSDAEIDRIHAPIGVDIHAIGAKEIALSIMAEIIQKKNEGKR